MWTGVIDGGERSMRVLRMELGPLKEQPVVLTFEPSHPSLLCIL